MRVGWLADTADHEGGAELTQAEFRAAAPEGVEVVDCPPDMVEQSLDRYVIQNCVKYTLKDLEVINGPTFKYWHDVGPWIQPPVKAWLNEHALQMCCSPIQAEYMQIEAVLIPPPVDLTRFAATAESVNGDRAGNVCIGSWRNYGKAAHKVGEWAEMNGPVAMYGGGPFAPKGAVEVPYNDMPALLARYERFVFLPIVIEPFGRLVAEAWAAGCEVVTNRLVGAGYWIQQKPEAIETAAQDFWKVVMS